MKTKFENVKLSTIVAVLVHGANNFGYDLAKTLNEQGARLVIIDQYTVENQTWIEKLKKLGNTDFVAFEGLTDLYTRIGRFDYMIYLQNQFFHKNSSFQSKDFLAESQRLEESLKAAAKFGAKTSLVSSIRHHRELMLSELSTTSSKLKVTPYSHAEIQRYSETLLAEYHDKSRLNARIIRIGAVIGREYFAQEDPEMHRILMESVDNEQIKILGDGLTNHFFIGIGDAIYAILKLTFDKGLNGEVISLCEPNPLSTLSLAYKLLELNTTAQSIKFDDSSNAAIEHDHYIPAANAVKYGFKSTTTLEEVFVQTLKGIYDSKSKRWNNKKALALEAAKLETEKMLADQANNSPKDENSEINLQIEKTTLGKIIDGIIAPFSWFGGKLSALSPSELGYKKVAGLFASVFILLLASYFLITPLISIGVNGSLIYKDLGTAYDEINALQFESAATKFEKIDSRFASVEVAVNRLEWAFTITGQSELYESIIELTFAAKYGIKGGADISESLSPLAQYANEFQPAISFGEGIPTSTREYSEYLQAIDENSSQFVKGVENVSLASNIINNIDVSSFPAFAQQYVYKLKDKNTELSEVIDPFKESVVFIPELLGVNGRQRYLILLQNPTELRSTGGWLSSYALLGIENGQIRQLEVDDIYNIDGQLSLNNKEYLPPQSMQNALQIDQYTMSLSNWDPNFPETASDASFFVKEAGKAFEIDGVIALNTELIKDLLDHWGGITVEGEAEKVTAENLDQKIFDLHSEFTPGSQLKTEFIANLADAVIKKLLSSTIIEYQGLAGIILQNLNEKHILVNLNSINANQFIKKQGWDGSIDQRHATMPFGVEWNWGANKANLYLDRKTNISIDINNEDLIRYDYSLSLKNNSTQNSYPEGDYVNWMRVYIPKGAKVESTSGFLNDQVIIEEEALFSVVSGWFNVEIGQTDSLSVKYSVAREDLGNNFPLKIVDETIEYDGWFYKQPGLTTNPAEITLTYPDIWILTNQPEMNRNANRLTLSDTFRKDHNIFVQWEK